MYSVFSFFFFFQIQVLALSRKFYQVYFQFYYNFRTLFTETLTYITIFYILHL